MLAFLRQSAGFLARLPDAHVQPVLREAEFFGVKPLVDLLQMHRRVAVASVWQQRRQLAGPHYESFLRRCIARAVDVARLDLRSLPEPPAVVLAAAGTPCEACGRVCYTKHQDGRIGRVLHYYEPSQVVVVDKLPENFGTFGEYGLIQHRWL